MEWAAVDVSGPDASADEVVKALEKAGVSGCIGCGRAADRLHTFTAEGGVVQVKLTFKVMVCAECEAQPGWMERNNAHLTVRLRQVLGMRN